MVPQFYWPTLSCLVRSVLLVVNRSRVRVRLNTLCLPWLVIVVPRNIIHPSTHPSISLARTANAEMPESNSQDPRHSATPKSCIPIIRGGAIWPARIETLLGQERDDVKRQRRRWQRKSWPSRGSSWQARERRSHWSRSCWPVFNKRLQWTGS